MNNYEFKQNYFFQIESAYRNVGIDAYGHKCEWEGCGWEDASCDVHHIDYQEQQAMEKKFRNLLDGDWAFSSMWFDLQKEADRKGWGAFNAQTRQLNKNDKASNLAVLCPNHHRYVHTEDLGYGLLKHIPVRKKSE